MTETFTDREKEYSITFKGSDFSISKTLKNKEDLDIFIKTLEMNCIFKKEESK